MDIQKELNTQNKKIKVLELIMEAQKRIANLKMSMLSRDHVMYDYVHKYHQEKITTYQLIIKRLNNYYDQL